MAAPTGSEPLNLQVPVRTFLPDHLIAERNERLEQASRVADGNPPLLKQAKSGGELVHTGPPQHISDQLVRQRLEMQAKALQEGTFAAYMRNYNIFTNVKKTRENKSQFYEEEEAYVRSMTELTGGPKKNRLFVDLLEMLPTDFKCQEPKEPNERVVSP